MPNVKTTKEMNALIKKNRAIEKAKTFLEKEGYFTYNLWCVDDVKSKFNCTDEEAQDVLRRAMQNDATMEQIWLAIDIAGESNDLERVEENEE